MIKPTDEMVTAFMRAAAETPVQVAGRELLNARAGLAAVLAIVEREYTVLCGAVRPPDDSGLGPLTCNGRLGHDPDHRHLDGDWMVTWP